MVQFGVRQRCLSGTGRWDGLHKRCLSGTGRTGLNGSAVPSPRRSLPLSFKIWPQLETAVAGLSWRLHASACGRPPRSASRVCLREASPLGPPAGGLPCSRQCSRPRGSPPSRAPRVRRSRTCRGSCSRRPRTPSASTSTFMNLSPSDSVFATLVISKSLGPAVSTSRMVLSPLRRALCRRAPARALHVPRRRAPRRLPPARVALGLNSGSTEMPSGKEDASRTTRRSRPQ